MLLSQILAAGAIAQTDPQPAFDVASVKPNKTADQANSNFPLGPGDAYTPNGGYFAATNLPLVSYIAFAYRIMGNQAQGFLDQLPAWVKEDRYDIRARATGNPGKDQMRLMMRSLLAERFKLAIHEEQRQASVLTLVVAKEGKLGPQIQPHPSGTPCPKDAPPDIASADPRFPLLCGGFLGMQASVPGRIRIGAREVTMDFMAKSFSGPDSAGHPVFDRTGLTGKFDFNLEWSPEIQGRVKPGAEDKVDRSGPTFAEALREQLGLKLVSQKTTVPVLVLDHVERPTEN
jgi:uncharacterized protein (TIGR03435 family)